MHFLLSAVVAALLVGSSCTTPAIEASAPVRGSPSPAASTPSPPANARQVRVVRVVDGDTLVLDGVGRARLIGIDTPEVHGKSQCLGREASAHTERLLGDRALVAFDVDPVDRYGRALVYVWSKGAFLNATLVADGFALPMTVPPNVRYAELFVELAARAREAQRGLWKVC
ncbi:MAG TPA: thermonuclease family protein [Actinomycetota bacterium]|jgi:micrococcal nuclease|nr:thermonuclease family protein [Actinomycetota bacterium]